MPITSKRVPVLSLLVAVLAISACGPTGPTPVATTKPKASPAITAVPTSTTALQGVVRAPAGIVAGGGGNIVAGGGGNVMSHNSNAIVAAGGGNVVAGGGGNIVAGGGGNIVAGGGGNIVAGGGLNYHLAQAGGLTQAPLAGLEVYLIDSTGQPVPGVTPVKTDANGRYAFNTLPAGVTVGVAAVVAQNGKDCVLRTSVVKDAATAGLDLDLATTMVATGLLAQKRDAVDGDRYRAAAKRLSEGLTAADIPDLADPKAVLVGLEKIAQAIAEVKQAVTDVGIDLAKVKVAIDEINQKTDELNKKADEINKKVDDIGDVITTGADAFFAVTVTGLAPMRASVGSLITITGSGFAPTPEGNKVTFAGGSVATVESATLNMLVVKVPAAAAAGPVTVRVGAKEGVSTGTFTSANPESGTFLTGQTPKGIAFDKDGRVWVINETSGDTTLLGADGTNLGTFKLGIAPQHNTVDGEGNLLVGLADNPGYLVSLDKDGKERFRTAVDQNPLVTAVAPNGEIWVTSYASGKVTRLSPAGVVLGQFAAGGQPIGLAFDGADRAWVADQKGHQALLFDSTGKSLGIFPVEEAPVGVTVDRAGNAWIANSGSHSVSKLDKTGKLLGTFKVGKSPQFIAFDGKDRAWVTNQVDNTVTVLNADGTAFAVYKTLARPSAIARGADDKMWIACSGAAAVQWLSSRD